MTTVGFDFHKSSEQDNIWVYYGNKDVDITTTNNTYGYAEYADSNTFITWIKPPNISMVYILAIGGGGAGGSGTTLPYYGGGGGASGGINTMLYPASIIPDILYVRPGSGGVPGTNVNQWTAQGGPSIVCFRPKRNDWSSAQNREPYQFTLYAYAPGGLGSAKQYAGNTENYTMTTSPLWASGVGNLNLSRVGYDGRTGTSGNTVLTSISYTDTSTNVPNCIVTAGAPGGGANSSAVTAFGGGSITQYFNNGLLSGGAAASGAGSIADNGENGSSLFSPMMIFYGGAGGGAAIGTSSTGGNGGDGGIGCGGGGGGAGQGTPGNGGRGGPGMVLIKCW